MRLLTSNVWGDYFGNPVEGRDALLGGVIKKYDPDIIGLQEMTGSWYRSALTGMLEPEYAFIGTGTEGLNNYTPLAVKKDHSVLAFGFELLTDTPDETKSITWAVLERACSGRFAVCCTHFWWPEDDEAEKIRYINARQLSGLMNRLNVQYGCPVFAFGDMNCFTSSKVFDIYRASGISDMRELAPIRSDACSFHSEPVPDDEGRYHGIRSAEDHTRSLDHMVCLGERFTVEEYLVIEDQDALDATDHCPVLAEVRMTQNDLVCRTGN